MDSQSIKQPYEDNREAERGRESQRSSAKCSEVSRKARSDRNADGSYSNSVASDRARTRTRDPDRDRVSDGEKESERYYSDEYDNMSPSDRSRSISPCSLSTSPGLRRAPRTRRPASRRGAHGNGLQRPGGKQARAGGRSQSKESPLKELDVVTKRVLSARLLKISEQRNQLSDLQQRMDGLQRENRALRQLQRRQERALERLDQTDGEVAQLIARHGDEAHVLRERLRRTQERERAGERRLREVEEELRSARAALQRLRKLAQDRQLGERDELARRLAQAQERAQDDGRRIKELERNLELSSGSFQRQLATERKKTHEVQEEVRALRDELERVGQKLKEKERELDTRNIYANRMARGTPRKEADSGLRRKGPAGEGSSRCSSKGVQTEERPAPLDFPTPPPAVADAPEPPRDGGYFALKELQEEERSLGITEEREREEKRHTRQEKASRALELREEEEEKEDDGQAVFQKEDGRKRLSLFQTQRDPEEEEEQSKPASQVAISEKREEEEEEEEAKPASQEEARRRKEQLLAKMREIDREGDRTDAIADPAGAPPEPRPPQRPSEPGEALPGPGPGAPRRPAHPGRRGLSPQGAVEDLSFGGYAPSFGRPAGRAQRGGAGGGTGSGTGSGVGGGGTGGGGTGGGGDVPEDGDPAREKKSNLMQQLFGSPVANGNVEASKMEVLSPPPPAHKAASHNGGAFPWDAARNPPARRNQSTLQVTESRPTVRAIASFDDDIEEVTL